MSSGKSIQINFFQFFGKKFFNEQLNNIMKDILVLNILYKIKMCY